MRTAARFRNGICLLHDPVNRLAVDPQDLHGLHHGVHLLERQQLAGDAPAPQDQQLVGAFIFSLSLRERSSSRQSRELSEERAAAVANLYARNRIIPFPGFWRLRLRYDSPCPMRCEAQRQRSRDCLFRNGR